MKVTNWRRKLMASLAAGGMLSPAMTSAANLDTNLVMNPGFESVDSGTTGDYGAPMILNWSGGPGFAYSHDKTATGVPDYAEGPTDPPNAGLWYFTSNNNPDAATGDWRAPSLVFQDIDVSTGPTGDQIGIGEAAFTLSAFMSSYLNDNDSGNVQVDFRNAGGTTISSTTLSDLDFGPGNVWSLNSNAGLVPAGTSSVRVSIFGTPRNGGADGYIDNVDFQIADAANELLFLQVDTTTGQVSLRNETGGPVAIDYYEIKSASDALNATAWNSLQEQNVAGFPAGNGSGNGWEQFGGSDAGVIGESFLTGNSSLANLATIGLGNAFNTGGTRDLVFRYGEVKSSVQVPGDYNVNGVVDAADYVLWRDKLDQNVTLPNDTTPGTVTQADYDIWRANFGKRGAPTGPSTLTTGFIRYVTSGPAFSAAVPEPSTVWLVGLGLGPFVIAGRRRFADD
jgi:hypothetical protein